VADRQQCHVPCSLDLAHHDFHLFPALRDHLSGHKFASDADMRTAVKRWLKLRGTN
jgi:hypothetical protein